MSPAVVMGLVQAAATYGPPIVYRIKAVVDGNEGKSDTALLAELDEIISASEASDARIQAHVHKEDRPD